jgi:hypothetical protein
VPLSPAGTLWWCLPFITGGRAHWSGLRSASRLAGTVSTVETLRVRGVVVAAFCDPQKHLLESISAATASGRKQLIERDHTPLPLDGDYAATPMIARIAV